MDHEKYLMALDQGTTSCRAVLFDQFGQSLAAAQQGIRQIYPQPGWVEQDAEEILATQVAVMHQALAKAGLSSDRIAAIGITNQRETAVLWDAATGKPLAPAIVWQCRRTAPLCEAMRRDGLEPLIRERTGLVPDAYFSATKWQWLFQQHPEWLARAERGEILAGTIDSWLIWNLTGRRQHVTDVTNASRTMLMNIRTGQWDDDLLRLFNLPAGILPRIVPSAGVIGSVDEAILPGGIPIAGVAGDQQAALFGQTCYATGMVKNTYGTGCFILMQTGRKPIMSEHGLLTTVAWDLGQGLEYALEGSVFNAGAAIQWLRDGLGIIRRSAECDELAAQVQDTDGVYFVPAFTGLGAPYWDMQARGMLTGLTRGTTVRHIARAVLEAIALQSHDVLTCMAADAGYALPVVRADGGASISNLLLQMQADFSQIPVDRPQVIETTALGAAGLAGLAVGIWAHQLGFAQTRKSDRVFEPIMAMPERDERLYAWHQAILAARQYGRPELKGQK